MFKGVGCGSLRWFAVALVVTVERCFAWARWSGRAVERFKCNAKKSLRKEQKGERKANSGAETEWR